MDSVDVKTDNTKVQSKAHRRLVLIAGMGVFTDAYDLFIIGVVSSVLISLWGLTIFQVAILNGSSLVAAAVGAITLGHLSDKLGRKRIYGFEMLILFFAALASAFSPSFLILLISRIFVGLAVGGDYPSSAVISAEHANDTNRGRLVLLVFGMQAIGLIVGPFIASGLLSVNLPIEYVWRILLGLGAIPAISVFLLRRRLAETPKFTSSKKITLEPKSVFKKYKVTLLGTGMCWFLFDIAFYGNSVSSILILKHLMPEARIAAKTMTTAIMFLCFALPGYLLAAKYVDSIGRRTMQIAGFIMMSLCYLLMAVFHQNMVLFIVLFGLSFFFINFGPNATTFLIPTEVFPTSIRASAHGISAALGKAGAFVGVFFMPIILSQLGLEKTFFIVSALCLLGAAFTLLLPEMRGKSIDF